MRTTALCTYIQSFRHASTLIFGKYNEYTYRFETLKANHLNPSNKVIHRTYWNPEGIAELYSLWYSVERRNIPNKYAFFYSSSSYMVIVYCYKIIFSPLFYKIDTKTQINNIQVRFFFCLFVFYCISDFPFQKCTWQNLF